ncbi:hypothetical protein LSAT2_000740 [Lamellibrachia satsuma]|nr:hypothetical protein LSAT2_000740 [Lamellibrachia satsuma]
MPKPTSKCEMCAHLVWLCMCLLHVFTVKGGSTLNPTFFHTGLRKLLRDAGYEHIMEMTEKKIQFVNATTEQDIFGRLQSLTHAISMGKGLLLRIQSSVKDNYGSYLVKSSYKMCCDAKPTNWNTVFRAYLDTDMCISIPCSDEDDPNPKYPTKSLRDTFVANLYKEGSEGMLWQYFGAENGVLSMYPTSKPKSTHCPYSDHRFRSWYINAATCSKDIVFAMDTHATTNLQFEMAKRVVKLLIQTLRHEDQVGLFAFDGNEMTWPTQMDGCFKRCLGQWTWKHVEGLMQFIDSLTASEDTIVLRNGVNNALSLLSEQDRQKRHPTRVVVVISGTRTSENKEKLLAAITETKKRLNVNAKFITINIGGDSDDEHALVALADLEPKGQYIMINLPKSMTSVTRVGLYDQLRPFYRALANVDQALPVVTPPYISEFGPGVILTMSMAVFYGRKFIGVVGVDVNLQESWNLMRSTDYWYVFVTDEMGWTIYHPMLPELSGYTEHPHSIRITRLEREASYNGVLLSMFRQESAGTTFLSSRQFSDGHVYRDSVENALFPSSYNWEPILRTSLLGCVVIGGLQLHNLNLNLTEPMRKIHFIYHMDFAGLDTVKKCRYYRRVATTDGSVVKFSWLAFQQPNIYVDQKETDARIRLYYDIVNGNRKNNGLFKDNVVSAVQFTSTMDSFWRSDYTSTYAVWRFVALRSNHIRIYPGIQTPKLYSPSSKNWFLAATNIMYRGVIAVTGPQLDSDGTGYTVTISRALQANHKQDSVKKTTTSANVPAVLGLDVTIEFFYETFIGSYPPCQEASTRCLVIDRSGYVVSYAGMVDPPRYMDEFPQIINVHLTRLEGEIAHDLIKRELMKKTSCLEMGEEMLYITYQLPVDLKINVTAGNQSTPWYEMYHIQNTNIFLLATRGRVSMSENPCVCTFWNTKTMPECKEKPPSECECPCYRITGVNICENQHTNSNKYANWTACLQRQYHPYDNAALVNHERELLDTLPDCYPTTCSSYHVSKECHLHVGCRWCSVNSQGHPLHEESFCANVSMCYFGMMGHPGPYYTMSMTGPDPLLGRVVFIFYVSVTSLLLIVAAIAAYKWDARRKIVKLVALTDSEFDDTQNSISDRSTVEFELPPVVKSDMLLSHKVSARLHKQTMLTHNTRQNHCTRCDTECLDKKQTQLQHFKLDEMERKTFLFTGCRRWAITRIQLTKW